MLSHSVKAKRRRNKTYYELVRKIQVRRIDRTTTGNHYLISLASPTRENFAHHFEVAGEKKLPTFYAIMLEIARQEARSLATKLHWEKHYAKVKQTGWRTVEQNLFKGGLRRGELSVISAHGNFSYKTMFGKGKVKGILELPISYQNGEIAARGTGIVNSDGTTSNFAPTSFDLVNKSS
jgi:hypothetical protein